MSELEPRLDTASALEKLGGDSSLLDELTTIFVGDSRELMRTLQQALAEENLPLATRSAHSLKSTALIIGARRTGALAREVELHLKSEQVNDARTRVAALEAELDQVLSLLEKY